MVRQKILVVDKWFTVKFGDRMHHVIGKLQEIPDKIFGNQLFPRVMDPCESISQK